MSIDIVDDPQGNGKEYSYQILRKWEEIIDSQHGSLENDLLRTLRRGTRTIIKEYSSLFFELDMISEESHFSASDPLFSFMNVFPELNPSLRVAPPKILFDRVLVKAIFDLEEERANEYSKILSSEFKERRYSANIRHSTITKSKAKGKLRMKFIINLGFMEYMDLSSIKSRLNETKYIILSKAKEIDMEAYENFCRSRLEIWLKRIRVHVVVYSNFEKEAIDKIKENFRDVLNYKSLISQKISKNLSKISFRLSFDVVADYSISETESTDSIPDRYTRLAVEELYRGGFMQALRYLEMGKNGLLGDLYTIKSKEVDSKLVLSRVLFEKAIKYYESARIYNLNLSNGYFDSKYKNNVLRALEINSDWIVSLKLFMEARRLEKDTISECILEEAHLKKKMQWELMIKRYSGLNVDKNLNDFVEEMGSFYSILLESIQRRYGIPPREILGFGF